MDEECRTAERLSAVGEIGAVVLISGNIPRHTEVVSVLAYGMVVLSLVVQGGLLLPVADLLGLSQSAAVKPPETSHPGPP